MTPFKNTIIFYQREIAFSAILIACLSFVAASYFLRFEASSAGSSQQVQATIVSYGLANGAIAGTNFVFTARLNNGQIVTITDWGQIPATYRGKIILDSHRAVHTGKTQYQISKNQLGSFYCQAYGHRHKLCKTPSPRN